MTAVVSSSVCQCWRWRRRANNQLYTLPTQRGGTIESRASICSASTLAVLRHSWMAANDGDTSESFSSFHHRGGVEPAHVLGSRGRSLRVLHNSRGLEKNQDTSRLWVPSPVRFHNDSSRRRFSRRSDTKESLKHDVVATCEVT